MSVPGPHDVAVVAALELLAAQTAASLATAAAIAELSRRSPPGSTDRPLQRGGVHR
ncbi:MAG: hypothetical protein WKF76_06175 [Nocardioidaceae bacterium]